VDVAPVVEHRPQLVRTRHPHGHRDDAVGADGRGLEEEVLDAHTVDGSKARARPRPRR
jgi:hypothetical protein